MGIIPTNKDLKPSFWITDWNACTVPLIAFPEKSLMVPTCILLLRTSIGYTTVWAAIPDNEAEAKNTEVDIWIELDSHAVFIK